MGFNCGLVGLPNAGKSTIFNALSQAGATVESYPFCTIDPHIGVVEVPDSRLENLAKLYPEKKKVPTTLEFVDLAGLVKGASEGEGLGNKFLAEIRNVDSIAHVIRCFEDKNIAHVYSTLDPKRDIEIVEMELILKDLEVVENKLSGLKRDLKAGHKEVQADYDLYEKIKGKLEQGIPIRDLELSSTEIKKLRDMSPLTAKPVLYVANVGEDGENSYSRAIEAFTQRRGGRSVVISGKIESEIAETTQVLEEREKFLTEWGIEKSGLSKLINAGYELLDLVTFFTTDGPEVRAWTVPNGTRCPQAGGEVHSDFEEGFIQAEVMDFNELVEYGSEKRVKEAGLLKKVGEDYPVKDGDIIHFIAA